MKQVVLGHRLRTQDRAVTLIPRSGAQTIFQVPRWNLDWVKRS
jgi:hypothetical protein